MACFPNFDLERVLKTWRWRHIYNPPKQFVSCLNFAHLLTPIHNIVNLGMKISISIFVPFSLEEYVIRCT